MDTLPNHKVDHDPSKEQQAKELPSHATHIINAGADFQDSIAEIVIWHLYFHSIMKAHKTAYGTTIMINAKGTQNRIAWKGNLFLSIESLMPSTTF